jgi:hypothetical protein
MQATPKLRRRSGRVIYKGAYPPTVYTKLFFSGVAAGSNGDTVIKLKLVTTGVFTQAPQAVSGGGFFWGSHRANSATQGRCSASALFCVRRMAVDSGPRRFYDARPSNLILLCYSKTQTNAAIAVAK